MELVTFIAESAADAAAQVRARLGPQAVVVQVRPLPDSGKGWLGRKGRPRFEVLAYQPEAPAPAAAPAAAPAPAPSARPRLDVLDGEDVAVPMPLLDSEMEKPAGLASGMAYPTSSSGYGMEGLSAETGSSSVQGWSGEAAPALEEPRVDPFEAEAPTMAAPAKDEVALPEAMGRSVETSPRIAAVERSREVTPKPLGPVVEPARWQAGAGWSGTRARVQVPPESLGCGWRIGVLLEAAGFLPREAQRVVDALRQEHGDIGPATVGDEVVFAKRVLRRLWRAPRPAEPGDLHVLVGSSGVGKTTCLSKWLTQVALGQGHPVRVWRLDGQTANTSDALVVYCDVLGVPLERRWGDADVVGAEEVGFVDLPGVDGRDPGALTKLGAVLRGLRRARVHLVVNGAYDMNLMLTQVRQFSVLPIEDLLVTHLDEESRWGKLWNLALGTNYTLRYLSAGQNVPGDFHEATPEALLNRQFPA